MANLYDEPGVVYDQPGAVYDDWENVVVIGELCWVSAMGERWSADIGQRWSAMIGECR